ncbi:hypothetical protein PR048_011851 [Dryococelus australis]|uniref:Uncharacterized protein n=1 Tax=Dryococelus australis TaxID=614101 RepID=A0ABQ9HP16_9NEOP|nr:hypothetical protein PR048_011851 [Dryococelus australis]
MVRDDINTAVQAKTYDDNVANTGKSESCTKQHMQNVDTRAGVKTANKEQGTEVVKTSTPRVQVHIIDTRYFAMLVTGCSRSCEASTIINNQ